MLRLSPEDITALSNALQSVAREEMDRRIEELKHLITYETRRAVHEGIENEIRAVIRKAVADRIVVYVSAKEQE